MKKEHHEKQIIAKIKKLLDFADKIIGYRLSTDSGRIEVLYEFHGKKCLTSIANKFNGK